MPELKAIAVQNYTGGRLDAGEAETKQLLLRGLAAARRFCGWHVTPVKVDHVVVLDGPGGRLLSLPTLRVVGPLKEVTEDGTTVAVADLYVSARGMVQKKSGGCWSKHFGAITVKMDHGFDEAPDFESAVLSWIDRASLVPSGGRVIGVGPFRYSDDKAAAGSTFTDSERALLEQYRLERPA